VKGGNGGRKGSPVLGVAIILVSFAVAGYLWMNDIAKGQKERIAYLENLSTRLRSEIVPLKFMVLSRENGALAVRIKLYDLSGREVAALEKSWPGTELYVDMLLEPIRSKQRQETTDTWLAFPYRIFTDQVGAAFGTPLFDAYDSGGFPDVLRGVAWSPEEEAVIRSVFAGARKAAAAGLPAAGLEKGSFGSAAREVSSLSRFEPSVVYKVVCRLKGGVEILEDRDASSF
jgi:hypothetical protein